MLLEIFLLLSDGEVDQKKIGTVMWCSVRTTSLSSDPETEQRMVYPLCSPPVSPLQQRAPGKTAESLPDTPEERNNCGSKYIRNLWLFTQILALLPGLPPLCTNTLCAQDLSTSASHIFCLQASLHTYSIALLLAESQLNKQNHCKTSQKLLWKCTALLCAYKTVLMLVWSLKCGLQTYSPQIYLTQTTGF